MPSEPEFECIVDDDESVQNSIEQLLDSEGLKPQSFEDAEDFLTYARSHAVPLAVLDVWMPKMSGLEGQKQLQVVSPYTKVIGITAREIPAIRVAAMEGGAFFFGDIGVQAARCGIPVAKRCNVAPKAGRPGIKSRETIKQHRND